jgi:hypothetical protein
MIAFLPGATRVDEALRVIRALGAHRYVAGRLHLVHAFAFAALADDPPEPLREASGWAKTVLADGHVDPASRDEALWRRSSDAEIVAVLDGFWTPGPRASSARDTLTGLLEGHGLAPTGSTPFDEGAETEMHPLLVDAGWELVPLGALDPARHAGAIGAFGDALGFASARFEEETAISAPSYLVELSALGPVELLRGAGDDGTLASPFVVWTEGDETYLDYVMRGVQRAAKLG